MRHSRYQLDEVVFAQCPDYPFWPARVIKVYEDGVYKVDFFNDNTTSNLAERSLLPFNLETITAQRAGLTLKTPMNKLILKAIKAAEK